MKGDYPFQQLVRVRWLMHDAAKGSRFTAHILAENEEEALEIGACIVGCMIPPRARCVILLQTAGLGRPATRADMHNNALPWETLDKWEQNAPAKVRRIAGRK